MAELQTPNLRDERSARSRRTAAPANGSVPASKGWRLSLRLLAARSLPGRLTGRPPGPGAWLSRSESSLGTRRRARLRLRLRTADGPGRHRVAAPHRCHAVATYHQAMVKHGVRLPHQLSCRSSPIGRGAALKPQKFRVRIPGAARREGSADWALHHLATLPAPDWTGTGLLIRAEGVRVLWAARGRWAAIIARGLSHSRVAQVAERPAVNRKTAGSRPAARAGQGPCGYQAPVVQRTGHMTTDHEMGVRVFPGAPPVSSSAAEHRSHTPARAGSSPA
jgi:hypothetical protein